MKIWKKNQMEAVNMLHKQTNYKKNVVEKNKEKSYF